jgi:hypothetical protein
MKRIVVQKELNYQVDKNNALVRSSLTICFVEINNEYIVCSNCSSINSKTKDFIT